MTPDVSLNNDWRNGILPLMKLALIMRNELDDAIISLQGKVGHALSERCVEVCFEAGASRYRENALARYSSPPADKHGREKDSEDGEPYIHDPLSSHFLQVIKHVELFSSERYIDLVTIELFLSLGINLGVGT